MGIDEDGNGRVNFSEFTDMCTKYKVDLPLGLDSLLVHNTSCQRQEESKLRCAVCDCAHFNIMKVKIRCEYGERCYRKNQKHLDEYAHPGDPDYLGAARTRSTDQDMCSCGHKRQMHASARTGVHTVSYPDYWDTRVTAHTDFVENVYVDTGDHDKFVKLMKATYSDVTTRDRAEGQCGDWRVPKDFKLVSVERNENSKLWRKYSIKKATLQQGERSLSEIYDDVKTSLAWEAEGAEQLDAKINEWYLWHGTSAAAARAICTSDFTMKLAGTVTGSLYGRGLYLAESITKADEYAKEENSVFTVLLCRVLGGKVRYTDDKAPDAEQLTKDCTEGDYECIIGDRLKTSGTYREFVIFDTENVYPEYILRYERGELLMSKSHPNVQQGKAKAEM